MLFEGLQPELGCTNLIFKANSLTTNRRFLRKGQPSDLMVNSDWKLFPCVHCHKMICMRIYTIVLFSK